MGDSGLPCGAPCVILPPPCLVSSHHMSNSLLVRKLSTWGIQISAGVPRSRSITLSRLTRLKADLTSRHRITACPFLARASWAFPTVHINASIAEWPLLLPICPQCSLAVFCSPSATTLSHNFPTVYASTIGLQFLACLWSFPGLGIMTTRISFHSSGRVLQRR